MRYFSATLLLHLAAIASSERQTVEQAAISARHLVYKERFGVLNSVYQTGELKGDPVGLVEYFADCGDHGDLTMLAITISTPYQQWKMGSPLSMAIRTHDKVYYVAAHERLSLQGSYDFVQDKKELKRVSECFFDAHPDAVWWKPGGGGAHESHFVKFAVSNIYYVGGFGSTKYIGFIPLEMYKNVTSEQIEDFEAAEKGRSEGSWRGAFKQKSFKRILESDW